jgi:hypothetical protein
MEETDNSTAGNYVMSQQTTQKQPKRPPARSKRLPLAEYKARQAEALARDKRAMGA